MIHSITFCTKKIEQSAQYYRNINEISFDDIYNKGLKVMDLTATTMCKENKLPIYVFNMDVYGNLKKVLSGEKIGTLVTL